METIFAVESTGSGHGYNPLGEAFSALGLVSKTELSPQDLGPDLPFGDIIGGFNSLMAEESEQMRPIAKRAFGSRRYFPICAALILEAIALHAGLWQIRGVQKLLTGYIAFAESVPTTQYLPHFLEHVFGKRIRIRSAKDFLEPLELSDQVCPAELPQSVFVITGVG